MSEIKEQYSYMLDDKFRIEDLSERKIFINCEIDEFIVDDAVRFILKWNSEDKGLSISERKPIKIYINSPGGSVTDGFTLIDAIIISKTPVYTINIGIEYSMGFLIGISGYRRYSFKNATYLLHDGQNFVWDSSAKVKDKLKFQEAQEDKIKEYVLSKSKLTSQEYDEKYRIEWYMFPEEAKEKGFVDYIIGVDCELDEVI